MTNKKPFKTAFSGTPVKCSCKEWSIETAKKVEKKFKSYLHQPDNPDVLILAPRIGMSMVYFSQCIKKLVACHLLRLFSRQSQQWHVKVFVCAHLLLFLSCQLDLQFRYCQLPLSFTCDLFVPAILSFYHAVCVWILGHCFKDKWNL